MAPSRLSLHQEVFTIADTVTRLTTGSTVTTQRGFRILASNYVTAQLQIYRENGRRTAQCKNNISADLNEKEASEIERTRLSFRNVLSPSLEST